MLKNSADVVLRSMYINGYSVYLCKYLEVATPTRRPFSNHGYHALTWRSHGHSVVGCLPMTSSPWSEHVKITEITLQS